MADNNTSNQPPKQPAPLKRPKEDTPSTAAPEPQASTRPVHEKVAAKHISFDATRPIRYAGAFVSGTITRTFDGMATGGRKGLWWGVAAGAVMAIGTGAILGSLAIAGFYGALIGIGIGGAIGLVTGGAKGVGREYRKEKYADELATKEDVRSVSRRRGATYHDVYAQSRLNANYNFDRMQQIARENRQDQSHYWRDRVDHEHMGGPHEGRGW